jgi:hypothetical protein
MPKTKISEYSSTANSNTDVASINVDEGCAPSGINNAIRAVMGHLKDFQVGTNGDSFNGPVNGTVGATTASTGAFTTLSASSTVSGTGFSTYLASPPAIGGTAAAAVSSTALSYTTTLTGGAGIINIGSGQIYKDASGNVGIGTSSPATKLDILQTQAASTSLSGFATTVTNSSAGISSVFRVDLVPSATPIVNFVARAGGAVTSSSMGFVYRNGAGNEVESMRIDSSGNLLVNTTSQLGTGVICVNTYRGGAVAGFVTKPSTNVNYDAADFYNSAGSGVGYISCTSSTTTYSTSSDYRLKDNVQPMTGALNKVALLKPVTYTWKADGSVGEGFIAHELKEVIPLAVTRKKDAVEIVDVKDEEGNVIGTEEKPVYQGIDTSFLVATLTAAIQEQQALITQQAAALTTLTERITALEAK